MEKKYVLVFDAYMLKQLKKVSRDYQVKSILIKMLDKIELLGPLAGTLIDSKLFLYELKNKHPPIRLYFKHKLSTDEIYVFEYEMKTSSEAQKDTLDSLRKRASET